MTRTITAQKSEDTAKHDTESLDGAGYWKSHWGDRILGFLQGPDVFISYSHQDGSNYADGVAKALESRATGRRLSCFYDQRVAVLDEDVPPPVRRRLKWSSILVAVATPGAARSAAIKKELATFKRLRRPVVIIAPTSDAPELASFIGQLRAVGAVIAMEAFDGEHSSPSPDVIARIRSCATFLRQRQRQLIAIGTALAIVVVLAVLSSMNQRSAQKRERIDQAYSTMTQALEDSRSMRPGAGRRIEDERQILVDTKASTFAADLALWEHRRHAIRPAWIERLGTGTCTAMALSHDGTQLAVGTSSTTSTPAYEVRIWSTTTRQQMAGGGPVSARIEEIVFSRDGSRLVVRTFDNVGRAAGIGGVSAVSVCTVHPWNCTALDTGAPPVGLALSDGNLLAVAEGSSVIIRDLRETPPASHTGRRSIDEWIRALAIDPSGHWVAAAGGKEAKVWPIDSVAEGATTSFEPEEMGVSRRVTVLAASTAGLLWANSNTLWFAANAASQPRRIADVSLERAWVDEAGGYVLGLTRSATASGRITVLRLGDGSVPFVLDEQPEISVAAATSGAIAVVDRSHRIHLWPTQQSSYTKLDADRFAVSPDGKTRLAGFDDRLELRATDGRKSVPTPGCKTASVAFSSDGRYAVAGCWHDEPGYRWPVPGPALVWDYQNQSSPTAIDVPIGESIAAWTSDGDLYLADGTGRTWAAAGDKKHEAPGGMDDRLLNRRLFAVGGARATRLWCASSGVGSGSQPARLMLGRGDQAIALGNCDRDVRVLAVSQQGRWGAVARDNGEIVLWDLDRRRKGPSLAGPGPQSVDVAFADNDQWIVGLFSDRRIRLWQSGNAFKERVSVSLGDLDVTGVIPARGSWPGLVLVTKDGLLELDLSKPTTPAPDR